MRPSDASVSMASPPILFGLTFLAVLFGSIVSTGYTAFVQSSFELNVLSRPRRDRPGRTSANTRR